MEQLTRKTDEGVKKRRFNIGIILIIVGLLGMLLTALLEQPQEQQSSQPAVTVTAES